MIQKRYICITSKRYRNVTHATLKRYGNEPLRKLSLQTAHILVDPQTEHVLAFLDFADAQAGDPLLDIAVVTLWDHGLTDFLLEGYSGIAGNEETQQLLSLYRLLRHLAEIPWLLERGFKALAERNITALQASLRA